MQQGVSVFRERPTPSPELLKLGCCLQPVHQEQAADKAPDTRDEAARLWHEGTVHTSHCAPR
jgi:hypothetical protein